MLKPDYDVCIKIYEEALEVAFALKISEETNSLIHQFGLTNIEKHSYNLIIRRYSKLEYYGYSDLIGDSNCYLILFDSCFSSIKMSKHLKELLEQFGFTVLLEDRREEDAVTDIDAFIDIPCL